MPDAYAPRERFTTIGEIDENLADAILECLGNGQYNHRTLNDLLRWHHRVNPDTTYHAAIESGLLELAYAIYLHAFVTNDATEYGTTSTGSSYHDQLLVDLGIYKDGEYWGDDFLEYHHTIWNRQSVNIGLPYMYIPEHARHAHLIHRMTGDYSAPPFDEKREYETQELLEILLSEECGESDPERILDRAHTHTHVPFDWVTTLQDIYYADDEVLLDWFDEHNVIAPLYQRDPNRQYVKELRNLVSTIPDMDNDAARRIIDYYYTLRESYSHRETVYAFRHGAFTPELYASLLDMPDDYQGAQEDPEWWTQI